MSVCQRKFESLTATLTQSTEMEEAPLIRTLETFIDQMNRLSLEIGTISEYIKHEQRYKINNEVIFGKIYAYPFNMASFRWKPSSEAGHIRIELKTNIYEIWDNIWKEDRDKLSEEFREFVKNKVSDFDLLEKNMKNAVYNKTSEHKTSLYNLTCLQEYIEDYLISDFMVQKFDSLYITYCTIAYGSIRIFFNFINVPNSKRFDDLAIDRVMDYLLPKLSQISIQADDISFVQFTELGGWPLRLFELFEDDSSRHDVRDKLLKEALDKIQAKRRCREQLKMFRESFEDYNEIFFFNNLVNPNHHDDYDIVMQLLRE